MSEHGNGHGDGHANKWYTTLKEAVQRHMGVKNYRTDVDDGIKHLAVYKPEELESHGITKGGKVNAEGLWQYINDHIAKPVIQKFGDVKDTQYLPSWAAVKSYVSQIKNWRDLLNTLSGVYSQTAAQHASTLNQQTVATLSTPEGKQVNIGIAKATGTYDENKKWIDASTDPAENAGITATLDPQLNTKVDRAVQTDSVKDLEARLDEVGHGNGEEHGGHVHRKAA